MMETTGTEQNEIILNVLVRLYFVLADFCVSVGSENDEWFGGTHDVHQTINGGFTVTAMWVWFNFKFHTILKTCFKLIVY